MPKPPEAGRSEWLPLFPLGTVLVPGMPLSLHIFEPRYRRLVADLLSAEGPGAPVFGVVALRSGWEVGPLGQLHEVGTTARVTDVLPHADGRCELAAVGESRFTLEAVNADTKPYLLARVRYLDETAGELAAALAAGVATWLRIHRATVAALGVGYGPETVAAATAEEDATALSYRVAQQPSLPIADRQLLLACPDTGSRLSAARSILRRETELLRQLRAIPATAGMLARGLGAG